MPNALKELWIEEYNEIFDITQGCLDDPTCLIDESLYDIVEGSLNLSVLSHADVIDAIKEACNDYEKQQTELWETYYTASPLVSTSDGAQDTQEQEEGIIDFPTQGKA